MAKGILNNQKSGVQSVDNVVPDVGGNVPLTTDDIGALATSGGNMTGPMTVQEPTEPNNPATLKKTKELVNGAWKTATGTLTTSGWSGRWQNISCPGLTTKSRVIASADGNSTAGTRAWKEADVWAAEQIEGAVRFYYYEDKPNSSIPVIIFYEVGA